MNIYWDLHDYNYIVQGEVNNVMDIKQEWKDDVNINKKQWIELLRDTTVIKRNDLELLELIYACGNHMTTASQIADILKMVHYVTLNKQVGNLGKRIANKLNIEAPKQKNGQGYNWFNVPFWGIKTDEGYHWILRPELIEAMEELGGSNELNLLAKSVYPDEFDTRELKNLKEGEKKQMVINKYERNPIARKRCIDLYGSKCYICEFDFEKKYGIEGKGVIHVHHLVPLSGIGIEYKVDPVKDLRPVCPNCHLLLHKKNPPYTIEEIKKMIR